MPAATSPSPAASAAWLGGAPDRRRRRARRRRAAARPPRLPALRHHERLDDRHLRPRLARLRPRRAHLFPEGRRRHHVPPAAGTAGLVTHRIHAITTGPDGQRVFRTKGDFNPSVDPWTFTLQNREQAKVAFHLPYVGFALAALADRSFRMLIIGIPALLVALSVLAGLWRDETAAEGSPGKA